MEEKEKINGFDDRNIAKTIEIIKENNKKRKNSKNQTEKDNEPPPFLKKITKRRKINDEYR